MRHFKIIFILCCSFLINSCSENSDIKIAVAGPLTGPYAAFGEQLVRGAEQAIKDINAAGGINGSLLVLIKEDDACEPKQAVAVANRAIDKNQVTAIVGHFCSSSTIPASSIYADQNILMITPASTNPKITERGLQTIFRTCGRDDQQGNVAAKFILENLHGKRVAIIHDKDTYGQGLANAMKRKLNALGQQEVLYEGITRGQKDFNALVTKLRMINADVVYFGGLHPEAGPLLRQIREQGLNAKFISGDGIVSKDFITAVGNKKFLHDVYMTFGKNPQNIPEGKSVLEKFKAQGFDPEGYTLYSYAAVQVIADALRQTKTTNGLKLSKWLKENQVETIMGTKSWDKKGDLIKSDYVIYTWTPDGNYQELNPS